MSKVVLGGGLSGLSTAYYLSKLHPNQQLTLIESANRVGGWIKSNTQKNGIIFEEAARTIRPSGEAGENTLKLIEALGLNQEIRPIPSNHPAAKNRMIYVNGKLHKLPSSIVGLFRKQEPFTKSIIRHLSNDLKSPPKIISDESIYDFCCRRFDKEIADYLISPLICGICAGNAKEISVNFLMKELFAYEQNFGNISNGIVQNFFKKNKVTQTDNPLILKARKEHWSVYSFIKGMETLPKKLEEKLRIDKNLEISLNTKCEEITFQNEEVFLKLNNNSIKTTNHLISTIPAQILSNLVQKQHPELGELLQKIKSASVAVVNLSFNQKLLKDEGFGFLVAPLERLPILGVIYDSCCFPKSDSTVLTVMMGGAWFEEYFGKNHSEDYILETALNQLKAILGIDQKPDQLSVRILHNCLPQYVVGHSSNLEKINEYIKRNRLPLSLCGASYNGVGVNDVILSAKKVVDGL